MLIYFENNLFCGEQRMKHFEMSENSLGSKREA